MQLPMYLSMPLFGHNVLYCLSIQDTILFVHTRYYTVCPYMHPILFVHTRYYTVCPYKILYCLSIQDTILFVYICVLYYIVGYIVMPMYIFQVLYRFALF